MYKILKNVIEMDDYSVQKLSNLQPPEPFEWNTVEGTELNVSDCIGGKGKIEVKGNTEQKQLSGNQLMDFSSARTDKQKTQLSFNNDIFTVTGSESTYNFAIFGITTQYKLNPGKVLKFVYDSIDINSQYGNIAQLRIVYNDGTPTAYPGLLKHNLQNMLHNIPDNVDNIDNVRLEIYSNNTSTSQNSSVTITKPMLQFGTEDKDYEPYCGGQAAPNPSYEIPIKVVTGDNVVKHVGKNLFASAVEQGAYSSDGSRFNSTIQIRTSDFIRIKPNTSYIFSNTNNLVIDRICYYDENLNFIERGEYLNSSTFTTLNNNCKYIRFNIKKDGGVSNVIVPSDLINPQIEQGSTSTLTPYEQYRGEEYKLDLWKENEFDSENANVIDALLVSSNLILTANSHERTVVVPCLKNTTYKISKTAGQRLRIAEFDENPQIGSKGRNFKINDQGNKLLYSTTGNYLAIGFYFTDVDGKKCTVEEMLNSIQIQEAIELCQIGDYKDIPFKNEVGDENYNAELENGAWYKKSAIAEVVLDGRETWNYNSGNRYFFTNKFLDNYVTQYTKLVSNNYIGGMASNGGLYNNHIQTGTAYSFMLCDNRFTDKNDLKTWLSTHNTIVKYPLATPTYEKITDPTLISQLEALRKAKWFKGVNHWWTETNNLEPVLKGTYRQAINE